MQQNTTEYSESALTSCAYRVEDLGGCHIQLFVYSNPNPNPNPSHTHYHHSHSIPERSKALKHSNTISPSGHHPLPPQLPLPTVNLH